MTVRFAYAQARTQARLGDRVTESTWRTLDSSRGLAQYLHAARGTALVPLVRHLSPASPVHTIERSLRKDWHAAVAETCRWAPAEWQPAVEFTTWLAELPALDHLLRDPHVPAWMHEDARLAEIAAAEPPARRQLVAAAGLPSAANPAQPDLLHAWLTDWQALWPDEPGNRPSLQHFVALVGALSAVATRRGEMPRLETKLARLLRSHRQQPVSLFCHLGLTALDLWRLRGALVQRAVFAAPGGQGS